MTTDAQQVLILGAGTRAAAFSALRAGLLPICAGLYADEDLRAAAQVLPLEDYPHDLPEAARLVSPCPFFYTGALENRPEIIAQIAAERPLWGNGPDVLSHVRDPFRLQAILNTAGLPALAVRSPDERPPADGDWLVKPINSGGGRRIRPVSVHTGQTRVSSPKERVYFQKRAQGTSIAAVFLADGNTARLMGVTLQLVGLPALNAPPFAYCGSIGPIELPKRRLAQIRRTGETLAAECALLGLFGCDFLDDGRDVWLTEVNPRYTASVEVIERCCDISLLGLHRRVCEGGSANELPAEPAGSNRIVGKAILYANRSITTTPPPAELAARPAATAMPVVADIPAAGTTIQQGHPICTVLADGADTSACWEELSRRLRKVSEHFLGRVCGLTKEMETRSSTSRG